MFPDLKTKSNPDERLGCQHSRYFSNDDQQGREVISPADMDLAHDAENALWQDTVLRAVDYDHIQAHARDGVVSLYGHVISKTNRLQAERAVRRVAGLQGVSNCLVADEELLSEVATALGSLEHAYGCKFLTGVSHGVVLLNGTVDDAATRSLAEQSAASNPNVRGVIDSVLVRRGASALPNLPFLQPTIGTEYFFLDGMSGRVRQVIIDPDNRRVVAITLRGRFTDQWRVPNTSTEGDSRPPERTLVLPLSTVRYLTKASGFLNIRSGERDQYSEYDATAFHAPPANWLPPYPYCPADVLFPAPNAQATESPERLAPPLAVALTPPPLKDELLENDSPGG